MTDNEKNEITDEINNLLVGTVIPKLLRIADRHNYDRDNIIEFAGLLLSEMIQLATFKNYPLKKEDGE